MTGKSFTPHGLSYMSLYKKLLEFGEKLDGAYDAANVAIFCMIAMHLHDDWLKKAEDSAGDKIRKEISDRDSGNGTKEIMIFLQVIRDVANSSKHSILTKDKWRQVTEVHDGQIRGMYDYFFRHETPGFVTKDNYYFSTQSLKDITIKYFDWVFSNDKDYPISLLEKIRTSCNMWDIEFPKS